MDKYQKYQSGLESPASSAFLIAPDDVTPLSQTTRAIYVGSPGNVSVTMLSGEQVVFYGVSAGSILPIRVQQVLHSGTSATQIIGLL